jgi:1-acyl-sn-glycerol-3-phosphate acyltransferase
MSPNTEPLPALKIRKWPRWLGGLYWAWTLFHAVIATVTCATVVLLFIWFVPSLGHVMPIVWSRWVLAFAGVRLETHFEAPLPDGPLVFVCNHQSNFDILALFVGLSTVRPFVYVAKKSVFSYPFLGWAIAAAKFIPVDRGNHAQSIKSLEAAGEKVRAGTSIMVFAEGTRSIDGSVLPFKKGAFHVAMKARVPLVPVAIEGALQVNPKRRWYVCPNTIRILVGPAQEMAAIEERDRDQVIRSVRSTVIRLHRRLGGLGGDEAQAIAQAGLAGIEAGNAAGVLR